MNINIAFLDRDQDSFVLLFFPLLHSPLIPSNGAFLPLDLQYNLNNLVIDRLQPPLPASTQTNTPRPATNKVI